MSVLAAEVPVEHRVFVPNSSSTGRHGSAEEGTLSDPITRYAYQIYQARWQRLVPDPINTEDIDRSVTDLLMDVPDSSVYKKRDTVLINGVSFVVQGLPDFEGWGDGLQIMSEYDDMFGGTVLIKRVT
jgi:hypothetical protein